MTWEAIYDKMTYSSKFTVNRELAMSERRITEYEIESHGVESAQYFQGAGLAFTRFEDIATGAGDSELEAYSDAVESLAQGDWDVSRLPTRPRGMTGTDAGTIDEEGNEFEPSELYFYVSIRVRGPKERKAPRPYGRDDVEQHSEGYGRTQHPAVNVKSYHFPRTSLVEDAFDCSEETAEQALQFAFESGAEQFWEQAREFAEEIFGKGATVYSEGRSGGWLIVQGIGNVSDWTAPDLGRWRRFEKGLKADIAYRERWETVREDIKANRWAEDGAELYNFIDSPSGPKCVAELNRAITAKVAETRAEFLK